MKYPYPNVSIRESPLTPGSLDADISCDRCMASAGQWCGPNADVAGPQRGDARCGDELPDAGRISVHRRADLSGPAHRAAEPPRDRAQDRGGIARCHPYRDRRADRLGGACLLHAPQARVHDLLHDALSGICRGPHHDSRQRRLRRAAALSCRCCDHHGCDGLVAAGTRRARLPQARLLDAWRRYRAVQPRSSGKARSAAADLHDHGPRCRGKKYRGVSFARSTGNESGGRRRTAEGGAAAEIPASRLPRREEGAGSDLASRRGRRVRVSQPHRHVWRRAARGLGLRHAGRGISGHRTQGCRCRSSNRRLDTDLRSACLRALTMSREACRNFALSRSWENSARQFLGNLTALHPSRSLRLVRRVASRSTVQG